MKKFSTIFVLVLVAAISFTIVIRTNERGVEVYMNNTLKYVIDGTSLVLEGKDVVDLKLILPGYWPVDFELHNIDLSSTCVVEVNFYPKVWGKVVGIPSGSKIYIIDGNNDIFLGKQPYEGWLPLGKHTFEIITPDGYMYSLEKDITESATSINLFKECARTVKIESFPKAVVYVDNKYCGETPITLKFTYGKHDFRFYSKGFYVGGGEIEVKSDDLVILSSDVRVLKGVNYVVFHVRKIVRVTLSSVPEGAYMKTGDMMYRLPVTLELPEGTRVAEVVLPGYKPEKVEFNPERGSLIRFKLFPDRKTVNINFDGRVLVNNEKKGLGPLSMDLLKGTYIMEFESGENSWFLLTDVSTDATVEVNKNNGTLVIGDIGTIKLNENIILTPAILSLPPGNYEIRLKMKDGGEVTDTVTVKRGKITYYPEDCYLVTVFTRPPGMLIKYQDKFLTTPVFLYPVNKENINFEFIYRCQSIKRRFRLVKDSVNFIFQSFRINPVSIESGKGACYVALEAE